MGAAEKKDRDEVAGAAARSAAELVDFAPDEIAALLDADADGNRVSGGRAASPETFAKLVHAMETRADELAAARAEAGDLREELRRLRADAAAAAGGGDA